MILHLFFDSTVKYVEMTISMRGTQFSLSCPF